MEDRGSAATAEPNRTSLVGLRGLDGCRVGRAGGAQFWALRHVTLQLDHGESLAVIGPNGAGKSTLLQTLAGIIRPSEGSVDVRGHVSGLLTLGAGFDQDMTGRDNILLGGAFLGLDDGVMHDLLPSIVEYAELGEFIDAPLKTYSSGMYMRLGFAVAIHVEPDVLLVDEVLAVGDEGFTHKCLDKFAEFKRRGRAILLVTHFMEEAERLCDRVAVFRDGRIVALDTPAALVSRVDGATRVRFVPSAALDVALLEALPEVTAVSSAGEQLVVSGSENLLHAVTSLLARKQVVARQLRVDQVSLDDAYVELTGGRHVEDH